MAICFENAASARGWHVLRMAMGATPTGVPQMAFFEALPHELPDRLQADGYCLTTHQERALVSLLDKHFGDGLVYISLPVDDAPFELAQKIGLIGSDGCMTRAGYSFWRLHGAR